MCAPRLLGGRRQARQLDHRADFDGTPASPWNPRGYADGLVEIRGIDQVVSAELLPCFRKRTVGHEPLALAHPNAGRRRRGVQRRGGQKLSARVELVRELDGLLVTLLPPGLVQCLLVKVNQQHVSHPVPPLVNRTARGRIDMLPEDYL